MRLRPVGEPIVVGENGHFLVTDGIATRTVVVTPEALTAMTGDKVASVSEFKHLIDVFTKIACENLANEKQYGDDRVWVLAADVTRWLEGQSLRWRPWRPRSARPTTGTEAIQV